MAERAVFFALEKLANPLIEEAAFLYGARGEVVWLRSELQWMECFLEDAESKRRQGGKLENNWLREVRDVSHRAEDIIDQFTLGVDRRRNQRGLVRALKRCAAFPSELKALHTVAAEIKGLRAKIDEIEASRKRHGLVNLGNSTTATTPITTTQSLAMIGSRRRMISDHDNTVVVGFDAHKRVILERLLDPNLTRRCVVSIVGEGGLGKTTLADKVYNTEDIKTTFEARACLSVSQDYNVREIYVKIVKQMMGNSAEELQKKDDEELRKMLLEFLTANRYLIVLDDVWSTDVWDHLKRVALPETNNGSRVLLTTRSMNVATSIDSIIPPYKLPFLNEDESWTLFLKMAFPYASEGEELTRCPDEELEGIGRRLVSRCGCLPLALVVLGGILSTKGPNAIAWRRVAEELDWGTTNPSGGDCLSILRLSYDNLPHHHLRSCFLYLGVFPEDYDISSSTLIQLWIAEGFIPENETQLIMEDTAQGYLEDLAQMSMIQVKEKRWLGKDASILEFRIHDLFRDFCIREAKENGFFAIYNSNKSNDANYHNNMIKDGKNWRHLAVHGDLKVEANVENWFLPLNLRSVLVFGNIDKTYASQIIINRLLRVIYLGVIIGFIGFPKGIVNLTHLRYLRFSSGYGFLHIIGSPIENKSRIPSSIANLCNLQTLHVDYGILGIGGILLTKSIGKLCTLRHIDMYRFKCPPDVGHLTNLQTLGRVSVSGGILGKLVNIRDLTIYEVEAAQSGLFLDSLRKIERLSTLRIRKTKIDLVELLDALSNHNHLWSLYLAGPSFYWKREPLTIEPLTDGNNGFRFPRNLTELRLSYSQLESDPMPTLEKLPNLMLLQLNSGAYSRREMVCTAGGFPRLQQLDLIGLEELEEWRVEDGAMPHLTTLKIRYCPKLSVLPEGLKHLKSLWSLSIENMSDELVQRLQQDGGEDWYKIRHVPHVQVVRPRSSTEPNTTL